MPLKYHCPKCGKRFVEWGAERLGFKCPDCPDEELVRMGPSESKPARRPTLKRALRRVAHPSLAAIEAREAATFEAEDTEEPEEPLVEVAEGEAEEAEEAEESAQSGVAAPELIGDESDEDSVDIDVSPDLAFDGESSTLSEEGFDDTNQGDWAQR